jgi:UDP-N-acetylmuramyl-tripeptide synthetase
MRLDAVLAGVDVVDWRGPRDVPVRAVIDDSRRVGPGDLFVAVSGLHVDGHRFVDRAAAAGAAAVVVSEDVAFDGPVIRVRDTATALGLCAANRAGRPGDRLTLVGITGTNGKTTTSYLLESILQAAGASPGVIGTVTYRFAGTERKAAYTTPTATALQGLLAEMVAAGCTHAILEVSSHALDLGRVIGLSFAAAGFTNLTQDHLDLHGTMEAYAAAKRKLFTRHLREDGTAVVWHDDPAADAMVAGIPQPVRRLGAHRPGADVAVTLASSTLAGLRGTVTLRGAEVPVASPMVGEHNLQNIAMAMTLADAIGVPAPAIAAGIARLAAVPGRLERVAREADVPVLVDYAHTPDALEHALAALRPICAGRLICVFGCGGDRDALKRPIMGHVVAEHADLAVVTSDNPRSEPPLGIIEQIVGGVAPTGLTRVAPGDLASARRAYAVEPDRRSAIRAAVAAATAEDVVLVAGKGHEDYQILGATTIHFDDREEARAALALRGGA